MLLPALNKVRDKAKATTCVNQVKQFHSAFMLYSADYNDYIPLYALGTPEVVYNWRHSDIRKPFANYLGKPDIVGNTPPFVCPADMDGPPLITLANKFSYGTNSYAGSSTYMQCKITRWRQPSATFLVADGKANIAKNTAPASDFKFWHNDSTEIGFGDGHIEQRTFLSIPAASPSQRFWYAY